MNVKAGQGQAKGTARGLIVRWKCANDSPSSGGKEMPEGETDAENFETSRSTPCPALIFLILVLGFTAWRGLPAGAKRRPFTPVRGRRLHNYPEMTTVGGAEFFPKPSFLSFTSGGIFGCVLSLPEIVMIRWPGKRGGCSED